MAPKKRKPSIELTSEQAQSQSSRKKAETTHLNDIEIDNQNKFKSLFDDLKKRLNQTELDLMNGNSFIKEHCKEIRRQVQLAKEIKIQEIEKIAEEIFDQIEKFEKKQKKIDQTRLAAELTTLRQEKEKWDNSFDEYEIDDQLIEQARERIAKLKFKRDHINKLLFDELLEFKQNADKISLGSLSTVIIDLSKLNQKVQFSNHIQKLEKSYQVKFGYFNSVDDFSTHNCFYCGHQENEHIDNEKIIDVNFNCLMCCSFNNSRILLHGYIEDYWGNVYDHVLMVFDVEKNCLITLKKLFVHIEHTVLTAPDKLCLVYKQNEDFPDEYKSHEHDQEEYETEYKYINDEDYFYLVLNKDLQKLGGMQKNDDLELNAASDSYLFSIQSSPSKILIYDWSFRHLKTILQSNDVNSPYGFTFDARKFIHILNKFYFLAETLKDGKHIRVIDERTNQLEEKHDYKEDFFMVDKNSCLILKNSARKTLAYMSKTGELLKEINIEHLNQPKSDWFLDEGKQTLCCFNKCDFTLWQQKILDEQNYRVF